MTNTIKQFSVLLFPFFIYFLNFSLTSATHIDHAPVSVDSAKHDHIAAPASLYENLNLKSLGLSRDAFDYGIKGYEYLRDAGKLQKDDILSIVDFSLPSSEKRLFVIDMETGKLLYNTYVAHGRNSGTKYAKEFSNKPESFKSSLGFYVTKNTYSGKHGFSLRLEGEEKGINDNALARAIVMHSADYVNKNLVKSQGYIGRSLGCPALPKEVYKPIIEEIKDGSCLFLYSPSDNYTSRSPVLQLASL